MNNNSLVLFGKQLIELLDNYESPQTEKQQTLKDCIQKQHIYNAWHTEEFIKLSIDLLAKYLCSERLNIAANAIQVNTGKKKNIAIKTAELWPLGQFQYLIPILLSGNRCIVDLDNTIDKVYIALCRLLLSIDSILSEQLHLVESKSETIDARIIEKEGSFAVDTDNYLTKNNAHLIFKETSLAILTGNETPEQLSMIAKLVFNYFGMNRLSIKKLLVPSNYNFSPFYDNAESHYTLINHNKYANNYQYHQSVYLMNKIKHLDNGFLLLTEHKESIAPTGVLYFEYYDQLSNIPLLEGKDYINTIYAETIEKAKFAPIESFYQRVFEPDTSLIDFINKQ